MRHRGEAESMSTGAEMGAVKPAGSSGPSTQRTHTSKPSLRERFERELRQIQEEEALQTALAEMPPIADRSAWAAAVHVGILRDRLRAVGSDDAVRGTAMALGWSSSRVGDLLKIRD